MWYYDHDGGHRIDSYAVNVAGVVVASSWIVPLSIQFRYVAARCDAVSFVLGHILPIQICQVYLLWNIAMFPVDIVTLMLHRCGRSSSHHNSMPVNRVPRDEDEELEIPSMKSRLA